MKKLKKLLILFCASIILCLGCAKKPETVTLEFWTLQISPASDNYIKTLIKRYESQNPNVKIKWVSVPYNDVAQKLSAAITTGNQPDAVNLPADVLAKYGKINALCDLSKLITYDSLNFFLPNTLQNCSYDGKVIALPWYLNTYVLLYNKELLEDAGFGVKDIPKTYRELIKFSKDYKNKTGKYVIFRNNGNDSYLPLMLESEGIEMTDKDRTKAAFNSAEGIELISQWVNLYRGAYIQLEPPSKSAVSNIEAYQDGQVAMLLAKSSAIKEIKTNAPEIYKNTDVSLAIVGKTGKHALTLSSLAITAGSKNKKEAAAFLMYVANAQNQVEFCKLNTVYPSSKEALRDIYFVANDGTPEAKARVIGAIELPYADRILKHLGHPQIEKLQDVFNEAIQAACLGKITIREAIDEAAEKWDELLLQQ